SGAGWLVHTHLAAHVQPWRQCLCPAHPIPSGYLEYPHQPTGYESLLQPFAQLHAAAKRRYFRPRLQQYPHNALARPLSLPHTRSVTTVRYTRHGASYTYRRADATWHTHDQGRHY